MASVVHPSKLMHGVLRWFLVPVWLIVMLAIAVGGLYLGYERPDVALAVVVLFFVGAWLFWSSWHETVKR